MDARRLLEDAVRRLAAAGVTHARFEAEQLLLAASGLSLPQLHALRESDPIAEEASTRFERMVARREGREPLQYILGTAPFLEFDLEVGPGALIPRPETEALVESLVARAGSLPRGAWIADVGTGSGAILRALLERIPGCRGVGIDRSRAALAWARQNLVRSDRLLVAGDLLSALRRESVWIIAANLPYIPRGEIGGLEPEVRDHEPILALDGGPDGLEPSRAMIHDAGSILVPGGLLGMELAPDQPARVARELETTGRFREIAEYRDASGRPRGVLAARC